MIPLYRATGDDKQF